MAEITKIDKLSGELSVVEVQCEARKEKKYRLPKLQRMPLKMLFNYVRIKRIP